MLYVSWDLDRDEAVQLVEEHLRAMQSPSNDVWVITSVDERDWGCIVSWVNGRAAEGSTAVADLYTGGGLNWLLTGIAADTSPAGGGPPHGALSLPESRASGRD